MNIVWLFRGRRSFGIADGETNWCGVDSAFDGDAEREAEWLVETTGGELSRRGLLDFGRRKDMVRKLGNLEADTINFG